MNIKKIFIAVCFSVVIILPWMAFTGDVRNSQAAGDYQQSMDDGGWGSPVWVPEDQSWWDTWLCNWFGDC